MLQMQRFPGETGIKKDKYMLYCDIQSAIHLDKNPTFHSKAKHIDLRCHWLSHVLDEGLLEMILRGGGESVLVKSIIFSFLTQICI